jgi:hypothetical protein
MDSDAAFPKTVQIPQVTIVIDPNTIPESISANPIAEAFVSVFEETRVQRDRRVDLRRDGVSAFGWFSHVSFRAETRPLHWDPLSYGRYRGIPAGTEPT